MRLNLAQGAYGREALLSALYIKFAIVFGIVFVSFFVAWRDLSIGTDARTYVGVYNLFTQDYYDGRFEFLYVALMYVSSVLSNDYRVFLYIASFLLLVMSYWSLKFMVASELPQIRSNSSLELMLFSFVLLSPFFFGLQVNILRHGLAVPFILVGFLFAGERKFLFSMLSLLIAFGFHSSTLIYVVLLPLLFLSDKKLTVLIVLLSVVYLFGLVDLVVKPIMISVGLGWAYQSIDVYAAGADYRTGVRFDFWVFSVFLIGLAFLLRHRFGFNGRLYKFSLVSFIPFLLFGHIAYSDRLLVFLWYMVPVVALCYVWSFTEKIGSSSRFYLAHACYLLSLGVVVWRLA